jgi:predicted transcriptional regulator
MVESARTSSIEHSPVALLCYSLRPPAATQRIGMSTTTIRIPDELKARLARLAELEGTSTHSLILDAIAEKVDEEAQKRLAHLKETGMGIEWADMKRYLNARMAGEDVPPPASRRIGS